MAVYTLSEEHKKALKKTLKPCPFCGFNDPSIVESAGKRHIECRNCGVQTIKSDNINSVVALWQLRT
jgi:transcription elongation factor Elf1